MTTQNNAKSEVKLAFHIGGGFNAQPGGYKRLYPQERLLKFLNVDINNKNEINNFCNKYSFVPRDIRKGLSAGFKIEHFALKHVVDRALRGELTNSDLRKINTVINTIETKIDNVSVDGLRNINNLIGRDYLSPKCNKLKYLTKLRGHKGTVVSLWEEAVNQIISNQQIRSCASCGQYFEISKQAPSHIYCSSTCRNVINQRNRRKRLKDA